MIDERRFGTPSCLKIAKTEIGSVDEITAPNNKHASSVIVALSSKNENEILSKNPVINTAISTPITAYTRIGLRFSLSSFALRLKAASNKSGGSKT